MMDSFIFFLVAFSLTVFGATSWPFSPSPWSILGGSGDHCSKSIEDHIIIVDIASLRRPSSCSKPKGEKRGLFLPVVNRHGPCYPPNLKGNSRRLLVEVLLYPAQPLDYDSYFAILELGSPPQAVAVIVDTGSDLSWVRCQRCSESKCPRQHQEPIFNSAQSSTYSDIAYDSPDCQQLFSATGQTLSRPPSDTCPYEIRYGDDSSSCGNLAAEKLTLGDNQAIIHGFRFLFGCGQFIHGNFGMTGGMLGLGRTSISIVDQLDKIYGIGKSFTYCLPTSGSSSGYLSFGTNGGFPSTMKFTPLVAGRDESHYYVDLKWIAVGGKKLDIPEIVFSNVGTIIDSGTIITRLPKIAYTALKAAFRSEMRRKGYSLTSEYTILDTCYDLSDHISVELPKIVFIFAPDVAVEVPRSGILWHVNKSKQCLAFAASKDDAEEGIIGSVQLMTMNIVHDMAESRIGFGAGGCT